MEERPTELSRISGAVEAVAQHNESRYSIKIGGEWYSGFGACPAAKGAVYVVDYTPKGEFRNIRRIREVGTVIARSEQQPIEARPPESDSEPPVGVRNYETAAGWQQATITADDESAVQKQARKRNVQIAAESLDDAEKLITAKLGADAATHDNILALGIHFSEKRTVHITKLLDEFLTAKVAAERRHPPERIREPMTEEAEATVPPLAVY